MTNFGGEVGEFGGESSPPPPPVDRTLGIARTCSVHHSLTLSSL